MTSIDGLGPGFVREEREGGADASVPVAVSVGAWLPRRPYVHAMVRTLRLKRLLEELAWRSDGASPRDGPVDRSRPGLPDGRHVRSNGGRALENGDPARSARNRLLRLLTIAAWIALLLSLLAMAACRRASAEDAPLRVRDASLRPPSAVTADTLGAGRSLAALLADHGLTPGEAAYLEELARVHAGGAPPAGGEVTITSSAGGLPERVRLALDRDRVLHLSARGARWTARVEWGEVSLDTVVIGGRVGSNPYTADLFGDRGSLTPAGHGELVHRLSRIFGWDMDFWRDVRPGDVYRAVIERAVRADGTLRGFRVLAAEYRGAAELLVAIRFGGEGGAPGSVSGGGGTPPAGAGTFFDMEGRSLRTAFLQAPLDYPRVTSRFDLRRRHPILKRRRPHLGVDYGAPSGTPVRATGAGVVTTAGWWGGYGRLVEIRHTAGIRTRYAHLSEISSGVRPGAKVAQGQRIGSVGTTGLSTAPHLHYEFLRHGRHVDPRGALVPRGEPVTAEERARFERSRDLSLALLAGLAVPAPAPAAVASAPRRVTASAGPAPTDD